MEIPISIFIYFKPGYLLIYSIEIRDCEVLLYKMNSAFYVQFYMIICHFILFLISIVRHTPRKEV